MNRDGRYSCGAHLKRVECEYRPNRLDQCTNPDHRCGQGRGRGTDHPGTGRCQYHGGKTKSHRVQAERGRANAAVAAIVKAATLREALDLVDRGALTGDAKAALREMLQVALWREQAVRLQAQASEALLFEPDHARDLAPHVLWQMHGEALKATAVIAKMLTDQQTGDDYVDLERQKLRTVADALEGALVDAALTLEAREAVLRHFGRRLNPIAAALPPGSQN